MSDSQTNKIQIPPIKPNQSPRSPLPFKTDGSFIFSGSPSTNTSMHTKEYNEIPIWFSVFFGKPDSLSPQLDNARFDARISDQVFGSLYSLIDSPSKSSFGPSNSSRVPLERPGFLEELSVFRALVSLSAAFEDEIFSCLEGGCIVCQKYPARSLVHRPLSATRNGYVELSDFVEVHNLVSTIASHTAHITRTDEVDWTIGSPMSDRPYVCLLAVPICLPGGECHQTATEMAQEYIEGIIDGTIKPKILEGESQIFEQAYSEKSQSLKSSNSINNTSPMIEGDPESRSNSTESSIEIIEPDKDRLCTIGATIFVGRPSLQIRTSPQRGQLSCLVLSSTWPRSVLPGSSKNEADEAIDYCRIAAYHEKQIFESADYRCAVCSEAVAANSLVHRPLLFTRTNTTRVQDEFMRQLIIRLAQFVHGRWLFPEMNATLGAKCDAHVFELVVPICASKTICEEVARTAAREFIKLLLPSDIKLAFPGLDPDTDLSVLENRVASEYEWKPETAELLVEKIGLDDLTMESEDRDEDPMDCSLTITKLRRWYELCLAEEEVKRQYLREIGYKRTGEYSETESEDSEVDDTIVWVYVRSDLTESSSDSSTVHVSSPEALEQNPVVAGLERLTVFQPTLSFNFWLICEAMNEGEPVDNAHESDGYEDDDGEYSSEESSSEGSISDEDYSSDFDIDSEN